MNIDVENLLKGVNPADYPKQCHAASLKLVKSGVIGEFARVARGTHPDIGGQHSWVVVSEDVYDEYATIIDPTMWSYTGREPQFDIYDAAEDADYFPKGGEERWDFSDIPAVQDYSKIITLEREVFDKLPDYAKMQMWRIGSMDLRGWSTLANGPMLGWPSRPIIEAMLDTPKLAALVPIDIQGMVTMRNPSNLYF